MEKRINALEERLTRLEQLAQSLTTRDAVKDMIRDSTYLPMLEQPTLPPGAPFMAYSSCHTDDFFHPRYAQLCKLFNDRPRWHRKQWEYVFILHHLLEAGVIGPGRRGIGFGVGREPLPSCFALLGSEILGTDAPDAIREKGGWTISKEHSANLEQLRFPWIEESIFRERVQYRPADMNAIDPSLSDFDFTWSSCCLEHLGTLQKGLDFIVNSVETCLKVGGVACHTTELNLSSNDHTVEASEATVLYRKRDLDTLVDELRRR
jgi:hypothetical protein